MKIFKGNYGWSTSAHSKNQDGSENKVYVDVQWPKGDEPMTDVVEGKLFFRSDDGTEKECFLSSYRKRDGSTPVKIVVLGKKRITFEQTSLTGTDRDVLGHYPTDNKVEIDVDELPFY